LGAGHSLLSRNIFWNRTSDGGWVSLRAIARLEGLGKLKRNWPHLDSNPPPPGL
jgi:hypothetical protein